MKTKTNLTLTTHARALLDTLARMQGQSWSGFLEVLLRQEAKAHGVNGGDDGPNGNGTVKSPDAA